jgi:hypothetical protein
LSSPQIFFKDPDCNMIEARGGGGSAWGVRGARPDAEVKSPRSVVRRPVTERVEEEDPASARLTFADKKPW